MINKKTVLAVIPARGGSKRCPRKNIRDFRGIPLLAWTYKAADNSSYIDRIILSTEDAEIKSSAEKIGFQVIERPADLATDTATCEDVIRHVLRSYPADWVVLLQPCSPLRTSEDIDTCIELAQHNGACISYSTAGIKNGAVFVARRDLIDRYSFSFLGSTVHYMPIYRSLDIDTEEQLAS